MISMVVRAFQGVRGVAFKSGDGPIDTTSWRTERQLHSTRYLRQATAEEEAQVKAKTADAQAPTASSSESNRTRVPLKAHAVSGT